MMSTSSFSFIIIISYLILLVTSYDVSCPLQCYNGGNCTHKGSAQYGCDCPHPTQTSEGYLGVRCETSYKVCEHETYQWFCLNGSTCDIPNKRCTCKGEFSGVFCGKGPVSCLDGLLCYNGKCRDFDPFNPQMTSTESVCKCDDGYSGSQCLTSTSEEKKSKSKMMPKSTKDAFTIVGVSVGSTLVTAFLCFSVYEMYLRKQSNHILMEKSKKRLPIRRAVTA